MDQNRMEQEQINKYKAKLISTFYLNMAKNNIDEAIMLIS